MNILVACEFSGIVREAFRKRGHNAWSCDLLPAEDKGLCHYQGNVLDALGIKRRNGTSYWDMMIAHPPCTDLAVSGARWFKYKKKEQLEALKFVLELMDAPIPKICLENPVSVISTRIRKPEQIVQPYMFGDMEQKTTCLWLKNLPKLVETDNVYEQMMKLPKARRERVHNMAPSVERWRERSRTYQGIADAMAEQWG